MIILTGFGSIWFLQRTETWSRWGFVIGLIGQPFWLYSTLKNGQWDMFLVTIGFGYCQVRGILNRFDVKKLLQLIDKTD